MHLITAVTDAAEDGPNLLVRSVMASPFVAAAWWFVARRRRRGSD